MTHFSFVFVVLVISCQSFSNGGWMQDFVNNVARNTASMVNRTIGVVQDMVEESKITENSDKPMPPTIGEALGRISNRFTSSVKEVVGNLLNRTEDKVEDEVKRNRRERDPEQTDDYITSNEAVGHLVNETEDKVEDEVKSNRSGRGPGETEDSITTSNEVVENPVNETEDYVEDEVKSNRPTRGPGQTEDSITTSNKVVENLVNETKDKVEDEMNSNRSGRGPGQTGDSVMTLVFNALRDMGDFIRHNIIENFFNTIRSGVYGFFQSVRKLGRRILGK